MPVKAVKPASGFIRAFKVLVAFDVHSTRLVPEGTKPQEHFSVGQTILVDWSNVVSFKSGEKACVHVVPPDVFQALVANNTLREVTPLK